MEKSKQQKNKVRFMVDGCHLVAGFVAGDFPVWIRKKPVNKAFSNIYLYLRQRKQRDFSRKFRK